jgi:hypothetical protein
VLHLWVTVTKLLLLKRQSTVANFTKIRTKSLQWNPNAEQVLVSIFLSMPQSICTIFTAWKQIVLDVLTKVNKLHFSGFEKDKPEFSPSEATIDFVGQMDNSMRYNG